MEKTEIKKNFSTTSRGVSPEITKISKYHIDIVFFLLFQHQQDRNIIMISRSNNNTHRTRNF